jgi:hypothetical protein
MIEISSELFGIGYLRYLIGETEPNSYFCKHLIGSVTTEGFLFLRNCLDWVQNDIFLKSRIRADLFIVFK